MPSRWCAGTHNPPRWPAIWASLQVVIGALGAAGRGGPTAQQTEHGDGLSEIMDDADGNLDSVALVGATGQDFFVTQERAGFRDA